MLLEFDEILKSKELQRNSYLEFKFIVEDEVVSSGTVLFVKCKHFGFLDPHIKVEIFEENDKFVLQLNSEAYARFVELSLEKADANFSDNYFDLSSDKG